MARSDAYGGRARLFADRYEPLNVLAQGGEALVWRSLDHQHDRVVALKVRRAPDATARAAALAEARTLLDLEPHRSIAVIRNDFFADDDHVLVMEYIDGEDLARRLKREGAPGLGVGRVLSWLNDVASALDHIHAATPAVVHGDVKPANIVVANGDPGRAVLVDFGLAGTTSRSLGTRGYAAPELSRGECSPAVDVFALAATAHALLTGEAPRPGAAPLTGRVRSVLARALAVDPTRRPATAGALIAELRAAIG